MTHQNERICWYCGSKDMEPDARGVRCRSCEATWNYVAKPGSDCITVERDDSLSPPGSRTIMKYRPSGIIARRAKKARGD